jgi:hypothetical protein
MTTYDQWKTTDPRDLEPEPEEEQSELELAYEEIRELRDDAKISAQSHAARIKELEAALLECVEYFNKHADIVDGDDGKQAANKEMQLGRMVDEALFGIRF